MRYPGPDHREVGCWWVFPSVVWQSGAVVETGDEMHVRVSSEQSGDARIVRAEGELDLHTAPTLQAEVDAALEHNPPLIVIDLTKVDFMDSTGLSVIVATVAAMRERGGEVRVVTGADKITKVFTLTGVDQQVGLFGSLEEALA